MVTDWPTAPPYSSFLIWRIKGERLIYTSRTNALQNERNESRTLKRTTNRQRQSALKIEYLLRDIYVELF